MILGALMLNKFTFIKNTFNGMPILVTAGANVLSKFTFIENTFIEMLILVSVGVHC